jgi:16S rRNA (uracil1498-N3)-methyltransferase
VFFMTATPAWPPQSTPRLFVETALSQDAVIKIDGAQAHYLIAVMRFKVGDPLKVCDNQTGEWLCISETIGKRDLLLSVKAHLRPRDPVPDLWLLAAPIKKARLDIVVEKACELGVALYRPVITRRTIIDRINAERLRSTVIEAAEQCGRTALPEIGEPIKLATLLREWPKDRTLYFADEGGGEHFAPAPGPAAILIGPEGGFDDEERAAIRALPNAVAVSLGPRILRAETAAIAAISVWMAHIGDW